MGSKSIQRCSSSSSSMICKHDVFLSFRGKDTRNNFTDHLFDALQRKCIFTFRDDKKLKKGEPISSELLQAIEGSRIFIVIFSKNYADSTWCLRELEKIADFIKEPKRRVLPIFYKVDPSEVRKQSGKYGEDFAQHEKRFKENSEMVKRWRHALSQVGELTGWDVREKSEAIEIKNIVKEVTNILGYECSSIADGLVGIHSPIVELEKLLALDSNDDARIIGICGMGRSGKTTLATVLYDRVSSQFDACCFIDDVGKIYANYGPLGVLKQLLSQTRIQENLEICNLPMAISLIRTRLSHIRALIILDNIDHAKQLEGLNHDYLGGGSRMIIISRDKHILGVHGVGEVYFVQLLNKDNALQLFCRKAFKCDYIKKGYERLAHDILRYANGLPLAIKVLGSLLFGLDIAEWTSALDRLRENPSEDIVNVLRISFDRLCEIDKEIFLDIACFFNHEGVFYVKRVLNCCGFHPDLGITVLVKKSLLTISLGKIRMHDLLQELGRKIVRERSLKEPGKWSRLWHIEHLRNVRLENTAIENPEAIVIRQNSRKITTTEIGVEVLSKMNRLRLLILWDVNFLGF